MSQGVTRCPDAMPIETLTAWYDHELVPDEAPRVRDHVRTCPACQRRLDEYGINTDRLRDFNAPDLHARIWRGVQQEIAHGRRRSVPRSVIGGVGAAAVLVALMVLLFTQLLAQRPGTATSTLQPTATHGSQPPTATTHPTHGSPTPTGTSPWHTVGPAFAQSLALAASDPQTLISCGFVNTKPDQLGNPVGALALGISHDFG